MKSFSPSLVLVALNFGAKKVPKTNAINETLNPVNEVNSKTVYLVDRKKKTKHIN